MIKISPEFTNKIKSLAKDDRVNVVVILRSSIAPSVKAMSTEERIQSANLQKEKHQKSIKILEDALKQISGELVDRSVNALGSIRANVPAKNIMQLVEHDFIEAIIEDQPIHLSFNQ